MTHLTNEELQDIVAKHYFNTYPGYNWQEAQHQAKKSLKNDDDPFGRRTIYGHPK